MFEMDPSNREQLFLGLAEDADRRLNEYFGALVVT
jgi:hypothetical protein